MEDDFYKMLAQKRQRDADTKEKYRKDSRERLLKICCTKVRTTMIGALESIEKRFKHYWEVEGKLNNEQLLLKKLYEEIRQEILDRGNTQIRNLETEFEQYEIDWKRYTLYLPVKQLPVDNKGE